MHRHVERFDMLVPWSGGELAPRRSRTQGLDAHIAPRIELSQGQSEALASGMPAGCREDVAREQEWRRGVVCQRGSGEAERRGVRPGVLPPPSSSGTNQPTTLHNNTTHREASRLADRLQGQISADMFPCRQGECVQCQWPINWMHARMKGRPEGERGGRGMRTCGVRE